MTNSRASPAAGSADCPLEQGEEAFEKATAVGQLPINRLVVLDLDVIGEMVVFVDEEKSASRCLASAAKSRCRRWFGVDLRCLLGGDDVCMVGSPAKSSERIVQ